MSIETTYGGQWSSDPALLKSLLDAGKTVIVKRGPTDVTTIRKAEYEGLFPYWMVDYDGDNEGVSFLGGIEFLAPSPRLEPIPLEWHHLEMGEEAIASSGDWSFYAWNDGDWDVNYDGESIAGGETMDGRGNFDTAKAAIHDWRVNILKSMTGGAKP